MVLLIVFRRILAGGIGRPGWFIFYSIRSVNHRVTHAIPDAPSPGYSGRPEFHPEMLPPLVNRKIQHHERGN